MRNRVRVHIGIAFKRTLTKVLFLINYVASLTLKRLKNTQGFYIKRVRWTTLYILFYVLKRDFHIITQSMHIHTLSWGPSNCAMWLSYDPTSTITCHSWHHESAFQYIHSNKTVLSVFLQESVLLFVSVRLIAK